MTFTGACEADGVPRGTGFRWLQLGADPEGKNPAYRAFREAVTRARAIDEERRVENIAAAGSGGFVLETVEITKPDGTVEKRERRMGPDWRADAWMLERTRPKDYGRRMVLAGEGEDGAIPVEVRSSAISTLTEKLSLMAERIENAGAGRPADEED
jgi:hypothetical protein